MICSCNPNPIILPPPPNLHVLEVLGQDTSTARSDRVWRGSDGGGGGVPTTGSAINLVKGDSYRNPHSFTNMYTTWSITIGHICQIICIWIHILYIDANWPYPSPPYSVVDSQFLKLFHLSIGAYSTPTLLEISQQPITSMHRLLQTIFSRRAGSSKEPNSIHCTHGNDTH